MKKDGGGLNAIDIEARIKANLAAWIPKAQKAKKPLEGYSSQKLSTPSNI